MSPVFEKLFNITFVKSVSAFGAEFRGIVGILGLPAAFVTYVHGGSHGAFCSALGTEFALVYASA